MNGSHCIKKTKQPDNVIIHKSNKDVKIIGVTIPEDARVNEREIGKTEQYKMIKDEITRIRGMEKKTNPLVIGALGTISTGLEKYVAEIGIDMNVAHAQKNIFIGDSKDSETGSWILKEALSVSLYRSL